MKKCFTNVKWFGAVWESDKLDTCVMFCLNCFTKAAFLNSYSVGKVFRTTENCSAQASKGTLPRYQSSQST